MNDEYKEKVYRLVYAVSHFPMVRMKVDAHTNSSNETITSVLAMLWGTGQTPHPHFVMATLMRTNADDAVRRLVAHADLRSVLNVGTRSGFYLSDAPTGLRGKATLGRWREKAVSNMIPDSSRTDALNDRLRSTSNPLWFSIAAQNVEMDTAAFLRFQQEEVILPKARALVESDLSQEEQIEQLQGWFASTLLSNGDVVSRAAQQFLCAELAASMGILQVVVVDDSIEDIRDKRPSTNALRFRNAYAEYTDENEMYEAWFGAMQAHDTAVRVLRNPVDRC